MLPKGVSGIETETCSLDLQARIESINCPCLHFDMSSAGKGYYY